MPGPCVRAQPVPWAQIGQLYKIFRVLGTPDATVWPGIEELPDWQPGFPKWQRQDLTQARPLPVALSELSEFFMMHSFRYIL